MLTDMTFAPAHVFCMKFLINHADTPFHDCNAALWWFEQPLHDVFVGY